MGAQPPDERPWCLGFIISKGRYENTERYYTICGGYSDFVAAFGDIVELQRSRHAWRRLRHSEDAAAMSKESNKNEEEKLRISGMNSSFSV